MMKLRTIEKGMLMALMVMSVGTAFAQPRRHGHGRHYHGCRRPVVTTVVTQPAVTIHVNNRSSKQGRLEMALAYLNPNRSLEIFFVQKVRL